MTNLNIKLHHGLVNSTPKQRAAAQTLGLNKIGKTVTREDTPALRGQLPLYMRLPKLRGFKNPFKKEYQVVNVAVLAELFPQGGEITVADLVAKGAVRNGFPVKVLGDGEVSAAYTLKGVKASASAKSKIEAAGGSISED